MSARYFLGVDDTDVLGRKPGTGRLARELGAYLECAGARCLSVVRQQLLVDPRIPYTSHNSPACIELDLGAADPGVVFEAACSYVATRAAKGSDPGVCLASAVEAALLIPWGVRAASVVVDKRSAERLAVDASVPCAELGGTGDGIIGALAAVGLTAQGDAGRYLEWQGRLRLLGECVSVGALMEQGITPIDCDRNARPVPRTALVHAEGWPRPRRIGGRAVLFVRAEDDGSWRCLDGKGHDPEHG